MTPEGIYTGTVLDARVAEFNGKDKIVIKFKVVSKHDGTLIQPALDRTVYMALSDAALPFTEEKLEKMGFLGDFEKMEFSESCYDSGVSLACKHREYSGKMNEEWDVHCGRAPKAAGGDTIAKLSERWKKAHPKQLSAAPKTREPGEDDDIPM